MNSRQRRGMLLLLFSLVCALGVFVAVLAVIRDVESKVGPEVTAYELEQDMPAYQELDIRQLKQISMPERWLPETAVTDLGEVSGKITVNPLRKGSLLQSDMVAERPALEPGQQEIAIMIDAATGVAGKITPGASVNIFATFANEREGGGTPESRMIVDHARVIDVGKLTSLGDGADRDRDRPDEAVPITFALSTVDAQRIAYAESFAENVRLALVAPGSDETIPEDERIYTLTGDK